jgi:hypothetical protein
MVGEVGFELAYALLPSFAFVGVELAAVVCEDLTWFRVFMDGFVE